MCVQEGTGEHEAPMSCGAPRCVISKAFKRGKINPSPRSPPEVRGKVRVPKLLPRRVEPRLRRDQALHKQLGGSVGVFSL